MATLETVDQSEPFSVAVVDDDPKLRTRLALQLGEEARAATFASIQALEQAPSADAIVVVLGPSVAADFAEVARLHRSRRRLSMVMVLEELSGEVLQRAIRAGVGDVVSLDRPEELTEAVLRAAELLDVEVPRMPATVTADRDREPQRGRIVTVFSTKGGAGKSFVSTNLAVVLARRTDRPVVLVDGDLQFGDVAVMLQLTPRHTLLDAVQQIDRLDADLLRSLLIRHEPSGLYVLPAPVEPAFADSVNGEDLKRILAMLASFSEHVVVDMPAHFNEVALTVLEECDDILLLAGMDVPHVKNVKIGLQALRLLNIPQSKVKLALNRANSKVNLDVVDVERTLQMKADSLLPSDIAVPRSINKGVPVVIDAPRTGVARTLERLADLFPAFAHAGEA